MKRTESGLWLAPNFSFLKHRPKVRTVTLPSGERAKVTVDDSGTVRQTETAERLDALVRPAPIRFDVRLRNVGTPRRGVAVPAPIQALLRNHLGVRK